MSNISDFDIFPTYIPFVDGLSWAQLKRIRGPFTSRWAAFVGHNNLSPSFVGARPGPNPDRLHLSTK
jgi:hypothetical protein